MFSVTLALILVAGICVPKVIQGSDTVQAPVLNPDTDHQPVKEYQGLVYVYFWNKMLSWIQAHKFCVTHGMKLADVPTKQHFDWITKDFILEAAAITGDNPAVISSWTSINAIYDDGHFSNIYTGRSHNEFYNSDPKPVSDGREHCLNIECKGTPQLCALVDSSCEDLKHFVCVIENYGQNRNKARTGCPVCPTPTTEGAKNPCAACITQVLPNSGCKNVTELFKGN